MTQRNWLSSFPPAAAKAVAAGVALLALVLAITWPWGADLAHSFADHWDPPLHAWKVWNMADAILHGRLLPPGTSLNVFYPSAGSLYHESLYWPQGVVAAPVLALSGNPVLAFHASYLFFWVLSALCFGALLKELGASRTAVAFGAAVFAILPVRTGYVVEFNMQLGFGPPLVLLFLLRWFRTRRPVHAAAAAAALCLQATSEMYTAVFFGLCLPFVLAALAGGRVRELLRDRRTWLSAAAAAAVGTAFAAVFFLPYLGQLGNTVSRSLEEVARHEAEPLSYLASSLHMAWRLVPEPVAKQDELCLYPTLAVLVLAAAFAAGRALSRRRRASEPAPARRRAEPILRALRAAALLLFAGGSILAAATGGSPGALHGWLPVPIAVLSLAIPFASAYRDERDRLLDGLFGAAVFAFLLSLGPRLTHPGADWTIDSWLFLGLRRAFGFLEGFRVVSRFGMVVLLFFAAAAPLALDRLSAAARARGGFAARAFPLVWAVAFALVAAESVPKPTGHRPADLLRTPVLERLDARSEPYCLLACPAWDRYRDSETMFRIGRTDRLLLVGWGGAFPAYSLGFQLHYWRMWRYPDRFRGAVWQLWPECLLLVDRENMAAYYPDENHRAAVVRQLGTVTTKIDEDDRFALLRILPRPAARTAEKHVRPDLVARLRRCEFSATPEGGSPVRLSLSLNGTPFFETEVPAGGASFSVETPSVRSDPVEPDRFRFSADAPFTLDGFRLTPLHETDTP